MEDNIFGIIEQLTKHDISKTEAVKKLLFLYNVVESKEKSILFAKFVRDHSHVDLKWTYEKAWNEFLNQQDNE